MIWTINRIIQNFRVNKGVKFSRGTITYFATRLGYHIKHSGGLIGYDKSLYTVLTSHYPEMVKYQNEKDIRKAQKALKREIDYNPDKFIEPEDRVDYDWEKNESRNMKKLIRLTESDLHRLVKESVRIILENSTNEINHIAEKSNVTICSLEDFKSLISSMGINDENVEDYVGEYCFIEIGSSYPRIYTEMQYSNVNVVNGKEYSPKEFYKFGQWYFTNEHKNVIKLEFDDNQHSSLGVKTPQPSKDPTWKKGTKINNATAVALRKDEMKPEIWDELNKKSLAKKGEPYKGKKVFYYTHAKGINDELISRIKNFVDDNLSINPDVKFVIHCRAGQSRSGALGVYLAKKVGQYTEDFLSEYGDQIKLPRMKDNGKRSKSYPHQDLLNGLSKAEGWKDLNGKLPSVNSSAPERWWYPEMLKYLEKNNK